MTTATFNLEAFKTAYEEALFVSSRDLNGIVTPLENRLKVAKLIAESGASTRFLAREVLPDNAHGSTVNKITSRLNNWLLAYKKVQRGAVAASVKFTADPQPRVGCPITIKIAGLAADRHNLLNEVGKINRKVEEINAQIETLEKAKALI